MRAARDGAVSGVLAALALPPFHLWPLALVALVPLATRAADPEVERRAAAVAGLAFGVFFYGVTLHWIPFTLEGLLPWGPLLGILFLLLLAGVGGAQGVVLRYLARGRAPIWLSLPGVWIGTEALLASAGPWAFPWTPLGLSLASVPALAGGAAWVGIHGLGLWIAAVNGWLASLWLRHRARGESLPPVRWAPIAGVSLLCVAPGLLGGIRLATLEIQAMPPLILGHLQVPRDSMQVPAARDRAAEAAILALLRQADSLSPGGERVPLLLPEAPFAASWESGVREAALSWAEGSSRPIMIGAHAEGAGPERPTNSYFLVEPGLAPLRVHDKRRLVPVVESRGLMPGGPAEVHSVGGLDLGILICFEVAFGDEARRLRRAGAGVLANPSNDAWFRPALGDLGSAGHAQHRAHLVMRAIENGMGAVRASVGGEILSIDPAGRIRESRPAAGEGVELVTPFGSSGTTPRTRFGDLGAPAAVVLLVLLLVAARRREGSSYPSPRRTA